MMIHFLFMQDECTRTMPRVPIVGEIVTFAGPLDTDTKDYVVSAVHWFDLEGSNHRRMVPYVSLRLPE